MSIINTFFGKLIEWMILPFRGMTPWIGMAVISLVTGIFMLLIFRLTSNQKGIRQVKDKIKAHLMEIRLFKDNLGLSLKAQGNILKSNLRYISYSAKPMLFMIIPLVLILIQMNLWFGYTPFKADQTALLKVKLKDHFEPLETKITVTSSSGAVAVESLPMRIPEEREIDWRLLVKKTGLHRLELKAGSHIITKTLDASSGIMTKISPVRMQNNVIDQLFNPGESPIPTDSPIKSVELKYPPQRMSLFGWHIHWLIVYFALSVLFGFALKGVFGVDI